MSLVWESYKLDPYVQRLAEMVVTFQEKVDDLLVVDEEINVDVRSLESCPYATNAFSEILGKIQRAVDNLSLHQYSNLHAWVSKLDEEVEARLAVRLQAGIEEWTKNLRGVDEDAADDADDMDTDRAQPAAQAHKLGGEPQIRKMLHEIRWRWES